MRDKWMKPIHNLAPWLLPLLFIQPKVVSGTEIALPSPQAEGKISLEQTLQARRSIRKYSKAPLTLEEISQLAWAAQGVTNEHGFRTAPSAGALYPLEIYVVASRVSDLESGLYRYQAAKHSLLQIGSHNPQAKLAMAGYNQGALRKAAAIFVIAGVKQRAVRKYGKRAERYLYIEAGHAGENLLLQATALGLGSVVIGAFHDGNAKHVLGLAEEEQVISLVPVGRIPK